MIKSVAVIGGGASAVLLLAQLAARPGADALTVDVYDREGRFARGVAYSTPHDCHLLNVRAANMSAYQDDKDHFVRWAEPHGYAPQSFAPRKLYGRYLAEQMARAAKRITISQRERDVVSCTRYADGYSVVTESGDSASYNLAVLASGNVRALRPETEDGVDGYFDDPWRMDLQKILNARAIALIGSGLSAVDMMLALHAYGYDGKIQVFSRNALLPAPHVAPAHIPPVLSDDDTAQTPLMLLRLLRKKARDAEAQGIPWQAVIDSLRGQTNKIWQGWTDAERRSFQKRLMTFWNVHRHRMAPQIANIIEAMRSSGQVTLVRASVRGIARGPVVKTSAGDFDADAVINCLGYRYDAPGREYEVGARIGPANFGALFETTAIPEIRAQAHALAREILP